MNTLKVSAVALSLLGVALTIAAVVIGADAARGDRIAGGVLGAGLAVSGGICFLGGAILTAVQPFAQGGSDRPR